MDAWQWLSLIVSVVAGAISLWSALSAREANHHASRSARQAERANELAATSIRTAEVANSIAERSAKSSDESATVALKAMTFQEERWVEGQRAHLKLYVDDHGTDPTSGYNHSAARLIKFVVRNEGQHSALDLIAIGNLDGDKKVEFKVPTIRLDPLKTAICDAPDVVIGSSKISHCLVVLTYRDGLGQHRISFVMWIEVKAVGIRREYVQTLLHASLDGEPHPDHPPTLNGEQPNLPDWVLIELGDHP